MSTSPMTVELRWTDSHGGGRAQAVEIQSIDRTCIRLIAPVTLAFGQTCEVMFGAKDPNLPTILVRVRDVRPLSDKRCRLICHFDEPLTDAVIAALADIGYFNRRSHDRRSVSLDVHARAELTQGQDPLGVRVVDLSPGGCCLKSRQEVPLGLRIMLSTHTDFRTGTMVALRVQWQQPASDGWLIGCSFCQPNGYEELAAIALEEPPSNSNGQSSQRLLQRIFFLASAGTALVQAVSMGTTPATSG